MQAHSFVFSTMILAALLPLAPLTATATEAGARFQLAMMDMMPMGGGTAPTPPAVGAMPGMPAPAGAAAAPMPPRRMGDDDMPMGAADPPATPAGQPAAPMAAAAMPMCPMCASMMQGMMGGAPSAMGAAQPAASATAPTPASSAALLDARTAEMRTALRITPTQAPAWDMFVASLRTGRQHLDLARSELQGSASGVDPMLRLVAFENHLTSRAEAIHITRMAFTTLLGQLDDEQKRAATSTMLPFIGAF